MTAAILELLGEETLNGRVRGSKNIRRTRKNSDAMWDELGCYARKAYRMSLDAIRSLHTQLEPAMQQAFPKRTRGDSPNGEIPTMLRLSAAIRFFAGSSIYDIMLTHGMGKQTVYKSVYGVVDAVNRTPSLDV